MFSAEPKIMLVDGSSAADAAHLADLAVIMVSRHEVEAGHIGDLVDRLMVFSDDPHLAEKFMGKMVLVFDGYNDDVREVTQIPDLVRFFVAVTEEWPYWLHFLENDLAQSVQVAINVYIESEPFTAGEGGVIMSTYDKPRGVQRIKRLFNAMSTLHEAIELPEAQRVERTNFVSGITVGITMDELRTDN